MPLVMHEASIMQAALESACDELSKNGARTIARLRLRVGVLSGVVPEALEFAFEALKAGTPAADASLEIEIEPAVFRCLDCEIMTKLTEMSFICPECAGCIVVDHGGNQLELTQLELN